MLPAQGLKEETTGVKFQENKVGSICSAEMKRSRGNDTTEQTLCKNKVRGQNMVSDKYYQRYHRALLTRTKVRVERNNEEFLRLT